MTTLPDRRVISSPRCFKKKHGLDVEQSHKRPGVPSQNFEKKNVLYEKGDEITRFDGILQNIKNNYVIWYESIAVVVHLARKLLHPLFPFETSSS